MLLTVPPGEAARFHFGCSRLCPIRRCSMPSELCRDIASAADLCARRPRFRAGRRRLAGRDQRRALSRFHLRRRRQRARPRASAARRRAHRAGAEALARLQPLPHSRGRAAGRAAVRGELRRPRLLLQFRRRGDGVRDQDGAQIPVRQRPARSAIASSPSKAPSTAARWRRSRPAGNKKYLEGFGPPVDGFDQVPFGDLEAVKRAIGAGDRGDPDRADHGRGRRARGRSRRSCGRCASFATSTACC